MSYGYNLSCLRCSELQLQVGLILPMTSVNCHIVRIDWLYFERLLLLCVLSHIVWDSSPSPWTGEMKNGSTKISPPLPLRKPLIMSSCSPEINGTMIRSMQGLWFEFHMIFTPKAVEVPVSFFLYFTALYLLTIWNQVAIADGASSIVIVSAPSPWQTTWRESIVLLENIQSWLVSVYKWNSCKFYLLL